jgi:hypothetical protein
LASHAQGGINLDGRERERRIGVTAIVAVGSTGRGVTIAAVSLLSIIYIAVMANRLDTHTYHAQKQI